MNNKHWTSIVDMFDLVLEDMDKMESKELLKDSDEFKLYAEVRSFIEAKANEIEYLLKTYKGD